MKQKISAVLIVSCLVTNLMAELPEAQKVRSITNQVTLQKYEKLMSNKKTKKVYDDIMHIFEKYIMKIAKKGFYATFSINIFNQNKIGITKLMKKLSKQEQDMMRQKIIKDLEAKGYKVTLNKFWNNPDAINISVSW